MKLVFILFTLSPFASQAQTAEKSNEQNIQDSMLVLLNSKVNWEKLDTAKNFWCDDQYTLTYNKKGKLRKVEMTPTKNGAQSGEDQVFYFNMKNQCQLKMLKALKKYKLTTLASEHKFKIELVLLYNESKLEITSFKTEKIIE